MKKLAFALVTTVTLASWAAHYEANWESLDRRETPQWFSDAKFGIFIHWGIYSVPAYAPFDKENVYACYAEWYQGRMIGAQGTRGQKAFQAHHKAFYGDQPYANFAPQFTARFFKPEAWARLLKKAGAKYVVLTSKHHDGYALWPSAQSPYFNSCVLGPGRDLCGEITRAMKAEGLKSGFYYSLMEYANPVYTAAETNGGMVAWSHAMNFPQMKELVEKYQADILWADGEWKHPAEEWDSVGFLTWLYNESSMKDSIAVNDRWGKVRGQHGGYYTTEYGHGEEGVKAGDYIHPWEECQGIGRSFGYNRFETTEQYKSREKCVETLVDIVSRGGNLLLDIGPDADGLIPVIFEDRLLAMGRWLDVNGEAIYGTRAWAKRPKTMKKDRVYFTEKGTSLYVISFGNAPITVRDVGPVAAVSLLGSARKVDFTSTGADLLIQPDESPAPGDYAKVWKVAR